MTTQNVTLVAPCTSDQRIITVDTGAGEDAPSGIAFDIPQPPPPPPPPRRIPMRAPPPKRVRFQQQQQQQHMPAPSPPPPAPEELTDFANPHKIEESPEYEESPAAEESPDEHFEQQYEYENHYEAPHTPQGEPMLQPTPPFQTLDDERADLLFRLQRAQKNGINVKTYSWNTDLRELRVEASRVRAEQEISASISFQRHLLMMICSGLEYTNKQWPYFDLELDGWSGSIMDDIGKYDVIFEKLHKKHAGNFNLPPELQLMFMVGGSAVTWHLVSKSAKDRTREEGKRRKRRQRRRADSSESESVSESSMSSSRASGTTASSEATSQRSREIRRISKPKIAKKKREMQGPGFDAGMLGGLGGIAGSLGGLGGIAGSLGGLGGLAGMASGLAGINRLPPVQSTPPRLRPSSSRQRPTIEEVSPSPNSEDDRLSDIPSEEPPSASFLSRFVFSS